MNRFFKGLIKLVDLYNAISDTFPFYRGTLQTPDRKKTQMILYWFGIGGRDMNSGFSVCTWMHKGEK